MPSTEIIFLPVPPGQRLCVVHPPAGQAIGAVLCIPPFAEEMNKSRRMFALQARALAQNGYATLLLDLHGTGDSSGDFAEATWDQWIQDIQTAAGWLRNQHNAPLWLWGLRTGALLAAAAAVDLRPAGLILWNPVQQGKQQVQQFLRLGAAAEIIKGDPKAALNATKAALANGQAVEIAGYTLTAELARDLDSAELTPPATPISTLWLECTAAAPPALTPAASRRIEQWTGAGHTVHARAVQGPAFWQTAEIETAPALIAATLELLHPRHAPTHAA